MIKTRYWNKLLLVLVMTFTLGSCELFDLDINEDPDNPTTAAINLLLAQAELSLADNLEGGINDNQLGFAGILALLGIMGGLLTSRLRFVALVVAGCVAIAALMQWPALLRASASLN